MHVIRINFYQKKFREKKNGKAPIVIRVNLNKKRAEIPTGVYVPVTKWDQDKGKAKGSSMDSIEANSILESFRSRIMSYYQTNINNPKLTVQDLKDFATGQKKNGMGVIELFDVHNAQLEAQVGIKDGYAKGTHTKFKTIRNHLEAFLGEDQDVSTIDYDLVMEFHDFLRMEQGISQNVTIKYIENFGKILRLACRKRLLEEDPTKHYNPDTVDDETTFLTEAELHRLETADMGSDALDRYRDFFVFSCYTALAYSDIKKLTMDRIFKRGDDTILIYRRKKSKKDSTVLLFDKPVELIEKYQWFRDIKGTNLVFPVPSNQQYNVHLKDVAVKAELPESINLTTHVARHTFGTTVSLGRGMNLKFVSSAMGHSSIKQTERYARAIDDNVINSMKEVQQKLRSSNGTGN